MQLLFGILGLRKSGHIIFGALDHWYIKPPDVTELVCESVIQENRHSETKSDCFFFVIHIKLTTKLACNWMKFAD